MSLRSGDQVCCKHSTGECVLAVVDGEPAFWTDYLLFSSTEAFGWADAWCPPRKTAPQLPRKPPKTAPFFGALLGGFHNQGVLVTFAGGFQVV